MLSHFCSFEFHLITFNTPRESSLIDLHSIVAANHPAVIRPTMPRKTRAAARAEEDIDIAIDASAEIEQNSSIESQKGLSIKGPERQPLQEVEVNASEAVAQHEQAIENETIPDSENNGGTKKDKGGKSTFKKKSGKKDGKGKKDNTAKRDEAASEARVQDQVAEDESASQTSSASQVAAEELRDMSQSGKF